MNIHLYPCSVLLIGKSMVSYYEIKKYIFVKTFDLYKYTVVDPLKAVVK